MTNANAVETVTKEGNVINIYLTQPPLLPQIAATVTEQHAHHGGIKKITLTSAVLYVLIALLAVPFVTQSFGVDTAGIWKQWKSSLTQPIQLQLPMISAVSTPTSTPTIPIFEQSQYQMLNTGESQQSVSSLNACSLDTGRVVTGVFGYSVPLEDADFKSLPTDVCYKQCYLKIEPSLSQVEIQSNTMRLVGTAVSTGKACNESGGGNNETGYMQKASLIPLYYGLEYAYQQWKLLMGETQGETKESNATTQKQSSWSLWDFIPDSVKKFGNNILLILFALTIVFIILGGVIGRIWGILVAVGIFWWVIF